MEPPPPPPTNGYEDAQQRAVEQLLQIANTPAFRERHRLLPPGTQLPPVTVGGRIGWNVHMNLIEPGWQQRQEEKWNKQVEDFGRAQEKDDARRRAATAAYDTNRNDKKT